MHAKYLEVPISDVLIVFQEVIGWMLTLSNSRLQCACQKNPLIFLLYPFRDILDIVTSFINRPLMSPFTQRNPILQKDVLYMSLCVPGPPVKISKSICFPPRKQSCHHNHKPYFKLKNIWSWTGAVCLFVLVSGLLDACIHSYPYTFKLSYFHTNDMFRLIDSLHQLPQGKVGRW